MDDSGEWKNECIDDWILQLDSMDQLVDTLVSQSVYMIS